MVLSPSTDVGELSTSTEISEGCAEGGGIAWRIAHVRAIRS
jgi:hypothetical protein